MPTDASVNNSLQKIFIYLIIMKKVLITGVTGQDGSNMVRYLLNMTENTEIYGATKASIIQITKYFGALYAKNKIIINCISPGGTIDDSSKVSKSFRLRYSKKVPMDRMGKPEEMITTIMYLASDYTTYTVGQNIVVDGGFSIWWEKYLIRILIQAF